jgi:hypothetical protein
MDQAGYGKLPLDRQLFEFHLEAAEEEGLVKRDDRGAHILTSEDDASKVSLIGHQLTPEGHRKLEEFRSQGFWLSNYRQLRSNVVTIAISVVTSVLTAWAIYYLGAPERIAQSPLTFHSNP